MKKWFKRKFNGKKRGLSTEEAQILVQIREQKKKREKASTLEQKDEINENAQNNTQKGSNEEIEALRIELKEIKSQLKHSIEENNQPVDLSENKAELSDDYVSDIVTRIQEAKQLQEELNGIFGNEVKDDLDLPTILSLLNQVGAKKENSMSVAPTPPLDYGW